MICVLLLQTNFGKEIKRMESCKGVELDERRSERNRYSKTVGEDLDYERKVIISGVIIKHQILKQRGTKRTK